MSDTLADSDVFSIAQQELWHAIADVLPGRVYCYAPAPAAAPVAPAIWIARWDSYVDGPLTWLAFTVTAVADGADHAAQAMLLSVGSGIRAAAAGDAGMRYTSSTATTLAVSGDVTLRAVDFVVEVAAGVHSFCPPVPHEALIPPTIINGEP